MEAPPSPEKSRSQPRYSLSTISQHLKTMATTTTTTATASAPLSPRGRSQQKATVTCKPTPSTSSSSSNSNSSTKKRPLPKEPPLTDTPYIQSAKVAAVTSSSSSSSSSNSNTTATTRSSTRPTFDKAQVEHDSKNYMFKLPLDSKGNIGKLPFLPSFSLLPKKRGVHII